MIDRKVEKRKKLIWFLISLGIMGLGGGIACMIIGNQLITSIIGAILVFGGFISEMVSIALWLKYM